MQRSAEGGHGPFRGLDAPFRATSKPNDLAGRSQLQTCNIRVTFFANPALGYSIYLDMNTLKTGFLLTMLTLLALVLGNALGGQQGMIYVFFFFQAEDGIRDGRVTGVKTCALPI